jgi:hypothetical protein
MFAYQFARQINIHLHETVDVVLLTPDRRHGSDHAPLHREGHNPITTFAAYIFFNLASPCILTIGHVNPGFYFADERNTRSLFPSSYASLLDHTLLPISK